MGIGWEEGDKRREEVGIGEGGGGIGEGNTWDEMREYGVSTGPQRTGPKMMDHEGKEVPGNRGYKLVMIINTS